MSWLIAPEGDAPPFDAVLALRPELRDLFRRFYGAAWDESLCPRDLLELCRLRIAALHGCAAELAIQDPHSGVTPGQRQRLNEWQDADCFTPAQRAALAIAEKMPWRHHEVDDREYEELRRHLTEPEVVALTVAVALFDAVCRLKLVFACEPYPSAAAPSASTPLP